MNADRLRLCLLYDCLFPFTIGGAERWYRNLAERLAAAGHDVTFVTLRQWEIGEEPDIPGVRVVTVGPRMPLYKEGKRRIWPPLRYGMGVFWHLLRNRAAYDQLHMASFPYFSLLAAAAIRPFARYRIAVDWFEVWSRDYWREYLGAAGAIGWWVQKLCARVPQRAFCFSRLHGARLSQLGIRQPPTFLSGLYAGAERLTAEPAGSPATLVCAGRMIPEKRVEQLVEALPLGLEEAPQTRLVLIGEGPERNRIAGKVEELGIGAAVSMPGFVSQEEFDRMMGAAAAVVQPSAREGYGLVVVEAAARGIPIVVAAAEDNASTELVEDGRNGFVAASAEARSLAEAILACLRGNAQLRASTRSWYAENERRLSLAESQRIVEAEYALNTAS
jgi:glycosyltransferase involved in cell wall biosynthesis